jgi:hypothetical protein
MSLEQSIYELTVAVNKLISIHEKYNQNSNADLNPVITPVIKMASEYIMEVEPAPTIKVVKPKPTPAPIATATKPEPIAEPAVTLDVLEMRDTIRTMCSEMVQGSKENKIGVGAIFSNYKATHLRMVDDATVPALYAELMAFKGNLK